MSLSLEDVGVVFEELGALEKNFAEVELDARMRSPKGPITSTARTLTFDSSSTKGVRIEISLRKAQNFAR